MFSFREYAKNRDLHVEVVGIGQNRSQQDLKAIWDQQRKEKARLADQENAAAAEKKASMDAWLKGRKSEELPFGEEIPNPAMADWLAQRKQQEKADGMADWKSQKQKNQTGGDRNGASRGFRKLRTGTTRGKTQKPPVTGRRLTLGTTRTTKNRSNWTKKTKKSCRRGWHK